MRVSGTLRPHFGGTLDVEGKGVISSLRIFEVKLFRLLL